MVTPGAINANQTDVKLKDRWPQWLERRYGTVEAMNRVYGAKFARFEDVPGSVKFIEKPFDICACDFRNYLNDRGYDWCKRQCDAIRSAAPGTYDSFRQQHMAVA